MDVNRRADAEELKRAESVKEEVGELESHMIHVPPNVSWFDLRML